MLTGARPLAGAGLALTLLAGIALVVVVPGAVPAAAHNRGLDHLCVADPRHPTCLEWIAENGAGDDPSDPVCTHLGEYVPCQSPWAVQDRHGWWIGNAAENYRDWSVWRTNDFSGVDGPVPDGSLAGCWAFRHQETGPGGELDAPGDDADAEGWWYWLWCLDDRLFDDVVSPHRLPGYGGEVMGWQPRGGGPAGDLTVAVQRAVAALDIEDPQVRTAPPSGMGSLPYGMPVWLAIDDTTGSAQWGPVSAEGCDGDLCVEAWSQVVETSWDVGDGHVETCSRERNVVWREGRHDFLQPVSSGACHYYYTGPSRDLAEGHYELTVTAVWQTHWRAPSLGITEPQPADPLEMTATATIRVEEIQVLVTSPS